MTEFCLSESDAIDYLKLLPSNCIDLIITDPAYESLEKHRKIGTTTRLKRWFPVFPNERFYEFFCECYRVLKNNSHFYIFSDSETLFFIYNIINLLPFHYIKPLIWDKQYIGTGYHYRTRYEFISFIEVGKRKLNDNVTADILNFPRIKSKYKYPTEKPVELFKVLIKQSSNEYDVVCDPFMGSGNVGVAALELNREFWGADISHKSIEYASNNLIETQNKLEKEIDKIQFNIFRKD